MILKILVLITIFILLSLLIVFLSNVFIPALKKQTNISEKLLFSKFEYKFEKLEDKQEIKPASERAVVLCSYKKEFSKEQDTKTRKGQSCAVINSLYRSVNDCKFSCIGLGDCIKSCPQEAISIVNYTAEISNLCNGCGKCLDFCPKGIIKLVPITTKEIVKCSNSVQSLTSCTSFNKVEPVVYSEKKGFKIWESCYRMLNNSL